MLDAPAYESVCVQAPGSRLILVGIANSIDLTERALPALERTGHAAQLITFPSYSAAQLSTLLSNAMAGLPGPAFHEAALKFCAKAVRHLAMGNVSELHGSSPCPAAWQRSPVHCSTMPWLACRAPPFTRLRSNAAPRRHASYCCQCACLSLPCESCVKAAQTISSLTHPVG